VECKKKNKRKKYNHVFKNPFEEEFPDFGKIDFKKISEETRGQIVDSELE
jgi:hypothetical protein